MDGLAPIRLLRQMPLYWHSPVLVLTSHPGEKSRMRGREAGATGWMVKPLDPQRLLPVIKQVLGS